MLMVVSACGIKNLRVGLEGGKVLTELVGLKRGGGFRGHFFSLFQWIIIFFGGEGEHSIEVGPILFGGVVSQSFWLRNVGKGHFRWLSGCLGQVSLKDFQWPSLAMKGAIDHHIGPWDVLLVLTVNGCKWIISPQYQEVVSPINR